MEFYKVLRWFVLAALIVVLVLSLKQPNRLSPQRQAPGMMAKNANSFQNKLGQLQEAHQRGEGGTEVRLTSDEVGAALVVANSQPEVQGNQSGSANPSPGNDPNSATPMLTPQPVGVKDPQVIFDGDEVKGQFVANVYGKDVFVTLSGHLGAKDGYATFHPTGFKIGSMPVPISMVQAQLNKKLEEPETREKLKLPEFVGDMKIENGQLVISEK